MTEPTQAQIDALKFYADPKTWEWHHDWEHGCLALQECGSRAKAALTAAAQVGDAQPEYLYIPETRTLSRYEKVVAATIERCAQIAERHIFSGSEVPGQLIAAAIRSLAKQEGK